eukprot:scaffold35862_cov51-Isochrysis_galbana.AAC.1
MARGSSAGGRPAAVDPHPLPAHLPRLERADEAAEQPLLLTRLGAAVARLLHLEHALPRVVLLLGTLGLLLALAEPLLLALPLALLTLLVLDAPRRLARRAALVPGLALRLTLP